MRTVSNYNTQPYFIDVKINIPVINMKHEIFWLVINQIEVELFGKLWESTSKDNYKGVSCNYSGTIADFDFIIHSCYVEFLCKGSTAYGYINQIPFNPAYLYVITDDCITPENFVVVEREHLRHLLSRDLSIRHFLDELVSFLEARVLKFKELQANHEYDIIKKFNPKLAVKKAHTCPNEYDDLPF
ncbi:hypothetical protein SAMN05216480_12344 [Pustulibacterium marinum]|uniref:Uncharacterized protein n=1 Tax=Pustulibacterium marinum TaxID=1224947 RepID=A0A1I7IWL5_9FLAO|nr:hypothetical protein [Pustulibacterium marinum]SFU77335.1 hypothetical protein SAMN05216480_12344 [Pustulibacterium marinum]